MNRKNFKQSQSFYFLKRLLICLLIAVGFFVIINFPYLVQQFKYIFLIDHNPTTTQSTPTSQSVIGEPNMLYIPSLNIQAPIQYVDESDEATYQTALQKGVVHYPGTAEIGQPGNPYIFGHSSDFALVPGDYKTVFALLPKIQNGAEILVTGKDGKQYTYIVTEQFVAEKTDTHLLDQGEYKEKMLTVQTSYPLGTALKRYIVRAKLVE